MNVRQTIFWMAVTFAFLNITACLPFLFSYAAASIAKLNGCQLDPVAVNQCLIWGRDWGYALAEFYGLGVFWPVSAIYGGITSLIWAGVALILWLRYKFQSRHRWAAFASGNYSNSALWLAAIPAGIAFFINAPVYAALAMRTLGRSLGCPVDVGGSQQCIVSGIDWHPALKAIYAVSLDVLPVSSAGAIALLVWAIIAAVYLILYLLGRLFRRRSGS